jgi:predicted metal-dependent phosphoesterase TrpH
VSVLAHPWHCKEGPKLIEDLVKIGLAGVEVYKSPESLEIYGRICDRYSIWKVGGSDFHGIKGHDDNKDLGNEEKRGDIDTVYVWRDDY